jgi:hypothetical protein
VVAEGAAVAEAAVTEAEAVVDVAVVDVAAAVEEAGDKRMIDGEKL